LVPKVTIVPAQKRCTKCGEVKPAQEFYAAKGGLLGRRPDCKACANSYRSRWARKRYVPKTGRRYDTSPENRARNLERRRRRRGGLRRRLDEEVRSGVKVCRSCREAKGLDAYKQVKEDPARYDATCRRCRAAQAKGARGG
jgi:hypothetical protein